jgi:hypothetical protein
MKGRNVLGLCLALATLLLVSVGVAAAAGDSYYTALPVANTPMSGSLAPGESMWYKFEVAQMYSWDQYRRDQREGNPIEYKVIRMVFSDAWNPQVAHNVGFYIYDPYRADLLEKGIVIAPYINEHGVKVHPVGYWAESTFEAAEGRAARERAEKEDVMLGQPKFWMGVPNDIGTYYIQIYNDAPLPMSYALTIGTEMVQWEPE